MGSNAMLGWSDSHKEATEIMHELKAYNLAYFRLEDLMLIFAVLNDESPEINSEAIADLKMVLAWGTLHKNQPFGIPSASEQVRP